MEKVSTIGLDLAKNVFQAHGADASGNVLLRKKLRRALRADWHSLASPAACDRTRLSSNAFLEFGGI
jgi:hypothetical protein